MIRDENTDLVYKYPRDFYIAVFKRELINSLNSEFVQYEALDDICTYIKNFQTPNPEDVFHKPRVEFWEVKK
jgi:hypothetical protein